MNVETKLAGCWLSSSNIKQHHDTSPKSTLSQLVLQHLLWRSMQRLNYFNSNLYTSEPPPTDLYYEYFFDSIEIPTIDTATRLSLNQPRTVEKILSSIREMNNSKKTGPDRLLSEFHKKLSTQLAPLLLDMFNHSLSIGTLPKTLTEVTISVILKKDKNPAECSSY